jgi:hypothetical protein
MIFVGFSLNNPFWENRFQNIWNRYWKVSKNKNLEIEFYKHSSILGFSFTLAPVARDHAGILFNFDLLGYTVDFNWYDSRHWDYKNDCWEKST